MLAAEVFYEVFKEVSGCLAIVTTEFHFVFQLFFRPHLSSFYSVVALKKAVFEGYTYLFEAFKFVQNVD